MKVPMIDKCPCCEIELHTEGTTEVGVPSVKLTVEPFTHTTRYSWGEVVNSGLHWRCTVCGCEWKHGQFSKDSAA